MSWSVPCCVSQVHPQLPGPQHRDACRLSLTRQAHTRAPPAAQARAPRLIRQPCRNTSLWTMLWRQTTPTRSSIQRQRPTPEVPWRAHQTSGENHQHKIAREKRTKSEINVLAHYVFCLFVLIWFWFWFFCFLGGGFVVAVVVVVFVFVFFVCVFFFFFFFFFCCFDASLCQ